MQSTKTNPCLWTGGLLIGGAIGAALYRLYQSRSKFELPIYLDYNATTHIDKQVGEAMIPYVTTHFGNPSSSHKYGKTTNKAMSEARKKIASMINCKSDEIIFTSCASESINHALKGAIKAQRERFPTENHIIVCAVEHVATLKVVEYLKAEENCRVTILPVTKTGHVDPEMLIDAVTSHTVLVSIMTANNEVGCVNDIERLARGAKTKNPSLLFHTDASQACGKIPIDVKAWQHVDMLTIAGHKLYGPKGIGATYISEHMQVDLPPFIHGAGHEGGKRAGTENIILAVGLGEACMMAGELIEERMAHMRLTRDHLLDLIREHLASRYEAHPSVRGREAKGEERDAKGERPSVSSASSLVDAGGTDALARCLMRVNGGYNTDERMFVASLPNTLSVSFAGVKANQLLHTIQDRVACSAGAACHTDSVKVSHVLEAMHVPLAFAMGTLRFSTGVKTTRAEIEYSARVVADAVADTWTEDFLTAVHEKLISSHQFYSFGLVDDSHSIPQ